MASKYLSSIFHKTSNFLVEWAYKRSRDDTRQEGKMKMAQHGYHIGDKLYELRRMRVLTQDELAELSGVHVITISYIEQGHRSASARTLKKLAAALDIDVKEFVENDID